ncbi:MAG: hypothetical protein ABIO48_14010 [Pedococcus sp.]
MSNPEAPKDDTMRLEQTVQTEPTEQLDTSDPTRAVDVDQPQPAEPVMDEAVTDQSADQAAADRPAGDTEAWPPPIPDRPSGPHAPAIVLGLVCLAVAVIVMAQEVGRLSVDWGDVGPVGIIATGAVLVLFGLVGLLTSRRKAND